MGGILPGIGFPRLGLEVRMGASTLSRMQPTAVIGLSGPTWGLLVTLMVLVLSLTALMFFMTRGRLTLDLGWGRTLHPLGPITVRIAAPRDVVFRQVAAPYLRGTPKDSREAIRVLEREGNMVVAAHRTRPRFFASVTVESVKFEPPDRVTFRHLRGPVPHAEEEFLLRTVNGETELEYRGTIGLDFWFLGRIAASRWARPNWERAVRPHLEELKRAAERRAAGIRPPARGTS
jgi:hypothetical protein